MHFATALVVHVPYELFHVENVIDGEKDKASQPQQQHNNTNNAHRPTTTTTTTSVHYTNNNRMLCCIHPHQIAIKYTCIADLAYAIIR